MFELHLRSSHPTPSSTSEGARSCCLVEQLDVSVYYRFPFFAMPEPAPRIGERTPSRRLVGWLADKRLAYDRWFSRWYGVIKWQATVLLATTALSAGLLWYDQNGMTLPQPDRAGWPCLLVLVGITAIVARHALPRRPIIRFRAYLLHPEAPHPYPTPNVASRQIIFVALRMTRRQFWQSLAMRRSFAVVYTDRGGTPLVTSEAPAELTQLSLRLLRYAFLSRLPEQRQPVTSAEIERAIGNALPSNPRHAESATHPLTGKNLANDLSDTEKAANAFRLAIYAQYRQLRWYLTMVLTAIAYGAIWHYDDLSRTVAIAGGLAWLLTALRSTSHQARTLSRWLHVQDPQLLVPIFELFPDKVWREVSPDRFRQQPGAEVGISHDRMIAIAVTVLFALYVGMMQLFSVTPA